jgi:hypothetical protein
MVRVGHVTYVKDPAYLGYTHWLLYDLIARPIYGLVFKSGVVGRLERR